VHAYPSGGGDYEVATVNLGPKFGIGVASALLVDYVLTVAVSVSSGVANLGSVVPFVATHKVMIAVLAVILLTAVNLRGLRESGTAFAIPTYGFVIVMGGMLLTGLFRVFVLGDDLRAPSADLVIQAEHSVTGFALVFLLLRTFSSGAAALTGVEAISNGVPAFRKPKSRNAATTLLLLGTIAITMLLSIIALARNMGLRYVDPKDLDRLTRDGQALPHDYQQHAVIAQLARAIFSGFSPGFYVPDIIRGKPKVFLSHGTSDPVLPFGWTSTQLAPALTNSGYSVRFVQFDGGHQIPLAVATEAMDWFVG